MSTPADADFRALIREIVDLEHGTARGGPTPTADTCFEQRRCAGLDAANGQTGQALTIALCHGGGTCALDLTAHPDSIEVAVHDSSPQNGGTGGFGRPP